MISLSLSLLKKKKKPFALNQVGCHHWLRRQRHCCFLLKKQVTKSMFSCLLTIEDGICCTYVTWHGTSRGVTGKFFRGGKVTFPNFFLAWFSFFPLEISIFIDPKKLKWFPKVKSKKKKKRKENKRSSAFFSTFCP